MRFKNYQARLFTVLLLLFASGASAEQRCGEVSIANPGWASARLVAEVDRLILRDGYGCDTRLVPADTMPTFTAMREQGTPDVLSELWTNDVQTSLDAAVADGSLVQGARVLSDGGMEGWWIPRFLADAHPHIRTVADALSHPELFPAPEGEGFGAIHNCPSGWLCHVVTANLFRALDADRKGFVLHDTGSSAELDASIARAHEEQKGWLGYYWAPTAMLARYDMVALDMGEHDAREWERCTAVPDCADPRVNGWPEHPVNTIVTSDFAERAGPAMDYVQARSWSRDTVNRLLAWMADNQASAEEAARYFIDNHEPVWMAWVPDQVRQKIKPAP